MPSKSSVVIARLVRTPLAQRMLHEMQLAGLAERTHESYLRAVSKLAANTKTAPDRITQEQPRDYLLVLRNEKEFEAGSKGWVTFTYRQSGSNRKRRMKVTAFEFLRRFLQHVLPPSFQKVRYYGFLSARRRDQFEHVRWLATLAQGQVYELTSLPGKPEKVTLATRPKCGNVLTLILILPRPVLLAALPPQPAMIDTS